MGGRDEENALRLLAEERVGPAGGGHRGDSGQGGLTACERHVVVVAGKLDTEDEGAKLESLLTQSCHICTDRPVRQFVIYRRPLKGKLLSKRVAPLNALLKYDGSRVYLNC